MSLPDYVVNIMDDMDERARLKYRPKYTKEDIELILLAKQECEEMKKQNRNNKLE